MRTKKHQKIKCRKIASFFFARSLSLHFLLSSELRNCVWRRHVDLRRRQGGWLARERMITCHRIKCNYMWCTIFLCAMTVDVFAVNSCFRQSVRPPMPTSVSTADDTQLVKKCWAIFCFFFFLVRSSSQSATYKPSAEKRFLLWIFESGRIHFHSHREFSFYFSPLPIPALRH